MLWLRAAGGWLLYALRGACWVALFVAWMRLWVGLGGLVDERMRWAAEWFIPAAFVFAWMTGVWAGPVFEETGPRLRRTRIWLPLAGMLLAFGWLWPSGPVDACTVSGACGLAWLAGRDIARVVSPEMEQRLRFRSAPGSSRFQAPRVSS